MRNTHIGILGIAALALLLAWSLPAEAGGKLDVNTATVEQLQAIKGIGPKTAQAIVDYRTKHGPFKSLDALVNVKGIGAKKLEVLRQHLKVRVANPCNPCAGK